MSERKLFNDLGEYVGRERKIYNEFGEVVGSFFEEEVKFFDNVIYWDYLKGNGYYSLATGDTVEREALYLTKENKWVLERYDAGERNFMKYISDEEALNWLKKNLYDTYEKEIYQNLERKIKNQNKNLGEVRMMERKTWKEFLESCDVSAWKWSSLDRLDIVDETEDEYIVRLSLADIIDDPFLKIEETENGETMINWGEDWVIITDFDENHDVFVKIYKAPDLAIWGYTCDGNLYVDEYEK